VQEGQTFVDVLDLVDAHPAVVGLGQLLARNDLEQLQQLLAVGQVGEQVLHLHARLDRVGQQQQRRQCKTQGGRCHLFCLNEKKWPTLEK